MEVNQQSGQGEGIMEWNEGGMGEEWVAPGMGDFCWMLSHLMAADMPPLSPWTCAL